ncbi:decarboxylating 6-phosphogluconate dehydrogenase [Candidatus Micrarchaeota archaeon]|nr:decarboxylating 6-phosphogluconate dehydrogenase [Candidatus Micrarchaeota archaeon]
MSFGIWGLGRMGKHMVLRLHKHGFHVVAGNRTTEKTKALQKEHGIEGGHSPKEFVSKLNPPRVVWIMVPHGAPVDDMISQFLPYLEKGDVIVDGGNSYYKDAVRRAPPLAKKGIYYLDIGTSGGLGGEKQGYCFMVGGDKKAYKLVEPALKVLAAPGGYAHFGPSGSGHFVKMVHNGIEYAILQSIGEGFELLKDSKDYQIDLHEAASVWNHGSVIRSWLMELAENALKENGNDLSQVGQEIEGGSTGEWTVQTGIEQKTPTPMISTALNLRYRSREKKSYAAQLVAALRFGFGGHQVKKE